MSRLLETFIEQVLGATTSEDLDQVIAGLRDRFEVDHLTYHAVSGGRTLYAMSTYTTDWVEHYVAQGYERVDPVVRGCFTQFGPINWKTLDWSSRPARRFFLEARDGGVGDQGLSVPLRGPSGHFALFTVNTTERDSGWERQSTRLMHEFLLVAHYINVAARRAAPPANAAGGAVTLSNAQNGSTAGNGAATPIMSLSPREADVLRLLALGHSRGQAAERLRISEHTFRAYLDGARLKLGSRNTTHAVATALIHGYITI